MRTVGIIANPASGKDIRRLIASGMTVSNPEKRNIIIRMIKAMDALGVERVEIMPDTWPSRKLISRTLMQPTVRNDGVIHRLLEIERRFQGLVTAPIATQDCPFLGTDACASDGNT